MQHDWQAPREAGEVAVRGEYRQIVPHGNGTDEEIGAGTLDPFGSTEIVELRRCHVVFGRQRQVHKGGEVRLQTLELCAVPNSGQDLLSNRSDDLDNMDGDQAPQFRCLGVLDTFATPQGQRPDTRVNQHPHALARCRL
jgi:hypothetical protein